MFTVDQLFWIYIVTLLVVFALLNGLLKTIRYCSMMKTYRCRYEKLEMEGLKDVVGGEGTDEEMGEERGEAGN